MSAEDEASAGIMCRLCLKETTNCISIFGSIGEAMELSQKIEQTVGLEISAFDNWPTVICCKCQADVDQFYRFQKQAQNSELHLTLLYGERVIFKEDSEELIEIENVLPLEQQEEEQDEVEIINGNLITVAEEHIIEYEDEIEKTDIIEEDEEELLENFDIVVLESDLSEEEEVAKIEPDVVEGQRRRFKEREGKTISDELIRSTIGIECSECLKKFSTFEELLDHQRKTHGIEEGYIKCCNRKFRKRYVLIEHVNVHLDPEKYTCKICQKRFTTKHHLLDHETLHIPKEQQPFECDKCSKRYPTQYRLNKHMKFHNDNFIFKCQHCDKA